MKSRGIMRASSVLFVLVVYMVTVAKPEVFTAIVDLEKLLYAEKGVADDLKSYIEREEARISSLKRLVDLQENNYILQ